MSLLCTLVIASVLVGSTAADNPRDAKAEKKAYQAKAKAAKVFKAKGSKDGSADAGTVVQAFGGGRGPEDKTGAKIQNVDVSATPATAVIQSHLPESGATALTASIIANDDFAATSQDSSVYLSLLSNDILRRDVSGSFTEPAHGFLSKDGSDLVYTPDVGFCGIDVFTYTLSALPDGEPSDTARVTIDVACAINSATLTITTPTVPSTAATATKEAEISLRLKDDFAEGNMNEDLAIPVLANDIVPQDSGGSFIHPHHGKLISPTPDGLLYRPDADFCGHDFFQYEITSGELSDSANVTIYILCDAGEEITEESAATDEFSILEDSETSVAEDEPLNVGTDENLNEDGIAASLAPRPGTGGDGTTDALTGTSETTTDGSLQISLKLEDDLAEGAMNEALLIPALANDIIPPGALGSFDPPQHGNIFERTDDGLIYMPDIDFCGYDSFQYKLSDGELSDIANVTIHILCPEPSAFNDELLIPRDSATAVADVLENDEANGSGSLRVAAILYGASHGKCEVRDGGRAVSYTLDAGYRGGDLCVYNACNGDGGCDSAVLVITAEQAADGETAAVDELLTADGGGGHDFEASSALIGGVEDDLADESGEGEGDPSLEGITLSSRSSSKVAMATCGALGATLALAGMLVFMKFRNRDGHEGFDPAKHFRKLCLTSIVSRGAETSSLTTPSLTSEEAGEVREHWPKHDTDGGNDTLELSMKEMDGMIYTDTFSCSGLRASRKYADK